MTCSDDRCKLASARAAGGGGGGGGRTLISVTADLCQRILCQRVSLEVSSTIVVSHAT